jgi:uncharacterized membrane protein
MRPVRSVVATLGTVLMGDSAATRAASLLATVTAGASFMPGLMPRGRREQVLVTGVAAALQHGLVMNAQARHHVAARLIASWTGRADNPDFVRVVEAGVAAGTAVVGAGMLVGIPTHPAEPYPRRVARTMGVRMLRVGVATLAIAATEAVDDQYGERHPVVRVLAPSAGFLVGAAVATGLIRHFRRYDPVLAARRQSQVDPLTGEELRPDRRPERWATSFPVSVGLGLGVAVVLNVVGDAEAAAARLIAHAVSRVLPGTEPYAILAGRSVVVGAFVAALGVGGELLYRWAEAGGSAIDAAYTTAPESACVSGGAESGIDWTTLSREGVRFVAMSLPRDRIADVTSTPLEDVKDPIRCFAGLETAPSVGARVSMVMEDMERLGAFDRAVICVASPTGTGYLNYVAIETLEYLTRGDCATVALQYSLRPSYLSLDRVRMAREQNLALLNAVTWRIRGLPEGKRPRLVGFGESLGAQTLQSCFLHEGSAGFDRIGMDAALFLGTPAGSEWATEWRRDPERQDPEGHVVEVANAAEWEAAVAARPTRPRLVLLNNPEDPITKFAPRMAVMRPTWLPAKGPRPPGVPESALWMPYTTFLVLLVDVINAIDFVPGVFVARGHDYRATIPRLVSEAYRLPVSDETMLRIEHALRDRERRWAEKRMVAEQMARAGEAVKSQVRSLTDLSSPGPEPASAVV